MQEKSNTRERYQRPVVGDVIHLRQFIYNGNRLTDVESISKVEIFSIEGETQTLVETIAPEQIVRDEAGQYRVDLYLEKDRYVIGSYKDVWTIVPQPETPNQTIETFFEVYADLWYTSPSPLVHDFDFRFRPNQIRQGSKQYLSFQIRPNVPTGSDLCKYYEHIIVGSQIYLTIEQMCSPCPPLEQDMSKIVDRVPIEHREANIAYYQLDTDGLDCGIYNLTIELELGANRFLSDRMQLEIY